MLERLLQVGQVLFESCQRLKTVRCRGAMILSDRGECRPQTVFLGRFRGERDPGAVHPDLRPIVLQPARVVLAGELVG